MNHLTETDINTLMAHDLSITEKANLTGLKERAVRWYCGRMHFRSRGGRRTRRYNSSDIFVELMGEKMVLHRLIAWHFIGDIAGKDIHHTDGDHKNNAPSNLCIVSRRLHRNIHETERKCLANTRVSDVSPGEQNVATRQTSNEARDD